MPYGSHLSEARLCWMAGGRIHADRLPVMLSAFFRPRHGSNELCQVCDRQIDRYQVEYQVKDARDGCELAFHLMCYRAWQLECQRLSAQSYGAADRDSRAAKPTARRLSSRP